MFLICIFTDVDRPASIATFGAAGVVGGGGGHQHHLSPLHSNSGAGNTSNFYSEHFGHQQLRHPIDDNGNLFSSSYPASVASEPPQQHIRLQSPPHRLNHRNRSIQHNQQYETGMCHCSF